MKDDAKITPPIKKPYRPPELILYGNIRQLTQAVDMMGAFDGGGAHNNKT